MAEYFQGMANISWCYDQINSSVPDGTIKNIIDRIAEIGYSGINFDTFVHVDANGKFVDLTKDKIDRMWDFVDYAKSKGLVINTKIHWSPPDNGNWNQYNTPSTFDISKFLTNQANPYLLDFAKQAQKHGVSKIFLGSESDNFATQQYHSEWANIVSGVRSNFSGKLTWDAIYFGTELQPINNVAIWDLLDSIGLSFYPSISAKPTYDVDRIVSLFTYKTPNDVAGGRYQVYGPVASVVEEVKALSKKYGLPVELGECNYQPIADNLMGYISEFDLAGVAKDYRAQEAVYKALCQLIAGPWKGIVTAGNFFSYDFWPYGFQNTSPAPFGYWKDFSLHGTPAEVVLANFIRSQNGTASGNFIVGGTAGADSITGTLKDEIFYGFEGNDTIDGGGGNDMVVYHGIKANFTINKVLGGYQVIDNHGDAGTDLVRNVKSLSFDDIWVAIASVSPTINVVSGSNSLVSGQTAKITFTLSQAASNFEVGDVAVSGGTLSGFTGSGTSYSAVFVPTANSTVHGVVSVASGVFSDAAGNANNDGNDANNTVTIAINTVATDGNDKLSGTSGNDSIGGLGGNDTLTGLAGDDTLDGGAGDDSMVGGSGDDTYYVDSTGDKVVELANQGTDTVVSDISLSLAKFANVENWVGIGSANIAATGNALGNALTGNSGSNTIDGGLGNDTLTGGAGSDVFVFSSKLGATNTDTITDFVSGTDKIKLSKSVFSKFKAGAVAEANFVSGPKALDSNDYLIFNGSQLLYDADGSGKGVAVVVANIVGSVVASDLLVV